MKRLGKYVFLLSVLTTLGLISCNACTKTDTVLPPGGKCTDSGCPFDAAPKASTSSSGDAAVEEVDAVVQDRVLSGEGWEFTVPGDWQVKSSNDPGILATTYHESDKELIMFLREPYTGPSEGYVLEALRGMKGAGAKMVSSKQVDLNGTKFTLLESTKDGVTVWAWVTVKSGFGYVFTCGGDQDKIDDHRESCFHTAFSLKIK